MTAPVVFLLDVDNTLLDNDRIVLDLRRHLERAFGRASADHYWAILDELRSRVGYADYLGALQRYRTRTERAGPHAQQLLLMSSYLIDYPFAQRLFPGALQSIAHLDRFGPTVILTDGDVVFQPRKVQRSGLWDAVGGRVLISIHKEQILEAVQRHYPAAHYVVVDDKLRVLAAIKAAWRERVTTVFARQGHFARDPDSAARFPAPDRTLESIAELARLDLRTLVPGAAATRAVDDIQENA